LSNYEYPVASKGHRFAGYCLDIALMIVTFYFGWLIWSLVTWADGLTPAKQILKMQVYSRDTKRPASWGHMAIRQFLIPMTYYVPGMLLGIASGARGLVLVGWCIILGDAITLLASQNNFRLTDMWAKTVVLNTAGNFDSYGVTAPDFVNQTNWQSQQNYDHVSPPLNINTFQTPQLTNCPNCGRNRSPKGLFCTNCGYNF
jgi:hypothetical protein